MVPIVDLAADNPGPSLEAGLTELGFVQLVNHGADIDAATRLRLTCDEFFALPEPTKRRWVDPRPLANRGFRQKRSESLSYSLGAPAPPDLFESFNCADDARSGDHTLLAPTPWPTELPELRRAAHRWLAEMAALAGRLDTLIDDRLGTDLAHRSRNGPDTMACIDYRPGPDGREAAIDGQFRMGAHSDYTTFTLLDADPVPGLQIVDPAGRWIDVVPIAGAILLNVGDLLAMLTNDTWPSTLHRVVPMASGCAPTRRSVAYFHYPDLDETIAPLPDFGPSTYAPVTVADHLAAKLSAPKTHTPSRGASTAAGRLSS